LSCEEFERRLTGCHREAGFAALCDVLLSSVTTVDTSVSWLWGAGAMRSWVRCPSMSGRAVVSSRDVTRGSDHFRPSPASARFPHAPNGAGVPEELGVPRVRGCRRQFEEVEEHW
jgi:hypothetical protein